MNPGERDRIFLSYSHRDARWLEEVQLMLKPMLRFTDVQTWSDKQIGPGEVWKAKIDDALRRTRVAVLLVSKHFLNSEFIRDHELPAMLAMRQEGLEILWMLVGNCPWEETDLFHIQALHDTSRPLDSLSDSDRDSALKKVCTAVKKTFTPSALVPPVPDIKPPVIPAPENTQADDSLLTNLLYATTAVNMGFITAERFTETCVRWNMNPGREIRTLLRDHDIDESGDEEIERVVARLLTRHAGNVAATLSAAADSTMRSAARQSQVPAIVHSIDGLPSDTGERVVLPELSARYERGPLHAPGKLGQIWSARDLALNREVALKVVAPEWSESESARQKLLREARVTGRLEHPFIVPVYDLAEGTDGKPFYSMRMLRGPTLAEQIARHHRERASGRVDPTERRRLLDNFKDVCLAVAYAHRQGVLHLDLKPQNVVLGEFGEVYLLDWGLSRDIPKRTAGSDDPSADVGRQVEQASTSGAAGRFGTPAYMSPEQAAGRVDLCDERTDVWGLGAVLFEILGGSPPHPDSGDQGEAFFERIQAEPRQLPLESREGPVESLASMCHKALTIDPIGRFATADEFAREVQRWLDEEPLHPYRASIASFEAHLKLNTDHSALNEGLARELFVLALIEGGLCRFSAACLTMARAEELYQKLCDRFPVETRLRSALVIARIHFARLMERAGEVQRAEAMRQRVEADITAIKKELTASRDHEFSILQTYMGPLGPGDVSESIPPPPVEANTSSSLSAFPASGVIPGQTESLTVDSINLSADSDVTPAEPPSVPVPSMGQNPLTIDEIAATPMLPGVSGESWMSREYHATRYSVSRPISKGGFSDVYLAYDNECDREVVIKRLSGGPARREEARNNFLIEGKITALLNHPNVPVVYSIGIDSESNPFIAMPYYRGRNLSEFLRSHGTDRPGSGDFTKHPGRDWYESHGILTAMRALVDACSALEHAHNMGILHRDVKPSNILLSAELGHTLLMDWGLAWRTASFGRNNPSAARMALSKSASGGFNLAGTPAYMSPEQACADVNRFAPASDIYSAGVILYEILARRLPTTSTNLRTLIHERSKGVNAPLTQTAPLAPPDLCRICNKAMRLNPAERYPDVSVFSRAIKAWLEGQSEAIIGPNAIMQEGLVARSIRWVKSWGRPRRQDDSR